MNDISNLSPALRATVNNQSASLDQNTVQQKVKIDSKNDSYEFSSKKEENNMKIGFFRIIFNRLSDEQINEVNRTGQLPPNAKFDRWGNIHNNFFNITRGTRTMPAGYELKKGIFGFTHLVLKDTKGLLIKDAKPTPKA